MVVLRVAVLLLVALAVAVMVAVKHLKGEAVPQILVAVVAVVAVDSLVALAVQEL